jgi:hypothetical protein
MTEHSAEGERLQRRAREALDDWDGEGQHDARALAAEIFDAVQDVIDELDDQREPKAVLAAYEKLAVGLVVVHATIAFETRVTEDGFAGYLGDPAATGLPEAWEAYRRIGATGFAALAERAARLFPNARPPREIVRTEALAHEFPEAALDALDAAFDRAFESEDPHRLRLEYLVSEMDAVS